MIRTLPLQFQANTVTEVQFNQFDPHSPPTTVLVNNPGDYWIYLTNIKQWIPPGTPNASYRWSGDMYAEVHTDRTPANQFGFIAGTNQSTEPCTITWTNDPTINPTGAANQFKLIQYPPTLIGSFVTVANGANQHFPTPVNNRVPGIDTYLLPAGTQSVIVVWSGDAPAQNNAPDVPLTLIVANSDGSIFWGGFNDAPGGTGGSFSDSVFQCAVSTAVDNGIRILINENVQAQTYYVLASPVPVAETVTIAGSDVAVAINLQEVGGTNIPGQGAIPVQGSVLTTQRNPINVEGYGGHTIATNTNNGGNAVITLVGVPNFFWHILEVVATTNAASANNELTIADGVSTWQAVLSSAARGAQEFHFPDGGMVFGSGNTVTLTQTGGAGVISILSVVADLRPF